MTTPFDDLLEDYRQACRELGKTEAKLAEATRITADLQRQVQHLKNLLDKVSVHQPVPADPLYEAITKGDLGAMNRILHPTIA